MSDFCSFIRNLTTFLDSKNLKNLFSGFRLIREGVFRGPSKFLARTYYTVFKTRIFLPLGCSSFFLHLNANFTSSFFKNSFNPLIGSAKKKGGGDCKRFLKLERPYFFLVKIEETHTFDFLSVNGLTVNSKTIESIKSNFQLHTPLLHHFALFT